MITQQQICLKLDVSTAIELENECSIYGYKRNRFINQAISHYIKYKDQERKDAYYRSVGMSSEDNSSKELGKYILSSMTVGQHEKLLHICKGLGTTRDDLIVRIITRMIDEYDHNPFLYI